MITVLLPTADRPEMLRTALASIARQTALHQIDRIYVSENGGNRKSEEICAEFPTLPIAYTFRVPTTPLEHGRSLMRNCLENDLIAFLHDDDWWSPHHLADGIAALAAQPDAATYTTGHFVVAGESSMLNCSGNLFPWFGANYPAFQPVWELSRLNVLMAELLGTIAHFSTMVVRTGSLRQAAYVFDLQNPFDVDRMLLFALSTLGPLLFNPVPAAFVRNHAVQDCLTFNDEARDRHMSATTRWMVEASGKSWDLVAKTFARRMSMCPPDSIHTLKALAMKQWCVPEIKRHIQGSVLV